MNNDMGDGQQSIKTDNRGGMFGGSNNTINNGLPSWAVVLIILLLILSTVFKVYEVIPQVNSSESTRILSDSIHTPANSNLIEEARDNFTLCSIESLSIFNITSMLYDDKYPIGTSIQVIGKGMCEDSVRASKFTINGESYAEDSVISTRSIIIEIDKEILEICFLVTNGLWDSAAKTCKIIYGTS